MTKTAKPRAGKSAAGNRRRAARAGVKRRARQKAAAERPKQKPRRAPKSGSRARRAAATVERRAGAGLASRAPQATAVKRATGRARRRASRTAPPPAFPQAVGASAKDQILFRMVRARAAVMAAIQGMSAASAERPLGEGKWNTRETILHLVTRDRIRLREMEAALTGVRPSWDGMDHERQALVNEEDLAPLRKLGWEEAVRLLQTTRQQLMEALESIPGEPEAVWQGASARLDVRAPATARSPPRRPHQAPPLAARRLRCSARRAAALRYGRDFCGTHPVPEARLRPARPAQPTPSRRFTPWPRLSRR